MPKDITPTDDLLPGTVFQLSWTITDENGTGITGAAAQITLDIRKPDGTNEDQLNDADFTEEGAGEYTYDYTIPSVAGTSKFYARWHYGGTPARDQEVVFEVKKPTVSYNP